MKTLSEICELVKYELTSTVSYGLCSIVNRLYWCDKLSYAEMLIFENELKKVERYKKVYYISINKPIKINKHKSVLCHDLYYWDPSDIESRIKWLNKRIKS